MRGIRKTGMLFTLTLLSLSACQSNPKPCDCGLAETELRRYAEKYPDAIADNGILRHQLKACQEKNP